MLSSQTQPTIYETDPLRPSLNYTFCALSSTGLVFAYLILAYALVLFLSVLVLAFRARNVSDLYNEARFVLCAILVLT